MKPVAVLGTGTMGAGIAQCAAQAGYSVLFWNRRSESVEKGLELVRKGLERLVKREKLTREELDATMERILGVSALEDLKSASLIVEAVPEDVDLKHELFGRLASICGEGVVFASNTSSLSITQLAARCGRPDRFVGLHFFNPVPAMKLVEVVSGVATSDATVAAATEFAEKLGKVAVRVRDFPGFVVNRVLMPMINEAANTLMQGVADAQAIDECMKLGCNHPMGPLALADLVGLDVVFAILDTLYREFGSPHYKPSPLIVKNLEAGWLGKKTGRGFYTY